LALLDSWRLALTGEASACRGPVEEPSLGRPDPASRSPRPRPAMLVPVTLPGGAAATVELRGLLAPRVMGPAGAVSLILGPKPSIFPERDLLRLFLDHVALSATTDQETTEDFRALLCRAHSKGPVVVAFAPLSRERARAYLTDLLGDALAGANDCFLPYEAVFRARKVEAKGEEDLLDNILQMRDDNFYRTKISTNFGPVPQPLTYPVPTLEAATAIVQRRFGLLFELLRESDRGGRKKS
jgi:hypothetical protein